MPVYTFHLYRQGGAPTTLDAVELPHDGASFVHCGDLLDQHQTCDYIEVWNGERSVVARYRDQPVIRPVQVTGTPHVERA